MLSGELAVLQAPMFDGLSLDPFALFDDGRCPAEVGVGRRHVVQALVIMLVVVELDNEGGSHARHSPYRMFRRALQPLRPPLRHLD